MRHFYPGAEKRSIRPGANDPQIIPVGIVLHVAVSKASSLFGWFNGPSAGIESHLYLRRDGTWEQYRSLGREADAQYKGNSWLSGDGERLGMISIETQGLGPGRWSRKQLAALKAFITWAHEEYDIPYRIITEPNPRDVKNGGVGYHTQFPEWSNVPGKTCPGYRRIKQTETVLRRWLREQRHPCQHCPTHCPKEN